MVYDDIDGLEEMLLDLSNVSLFSHFENLWLNHIIFAIYTSCRVKYNWYFLTGGEQWEQHQLSGSIRNDVNEFSQFTNSLLV